VEPLEFVMPRVLVVDDSPIDRTFIEGVLKRGQDYVVATANNGADALAKCADFNPDIVVTDLQMPELDGLQLVTAMGVHHPQTPVILITAHGSEQLAMKALEEGAASYVPKSQLANRLQASVEQILDLQKVNSSYQQLTECMEFAEFKFVLPYDRALVDRVVELVQQVALSMNLCDAGGQVRLGMAVEEGLTAMALRGNFELNEEQMQQMASMRSRPSSLLTELLQNEPYKSRRLSVDIHMSTQRALVNIRHDGPGLPQPPAADGDGTAVLESLEHRSFVLMRAFMDEVTLSADGRELTLVRQRRDSERREPAAAGATSLWRR
jgi:CheY-like chemotaxis protein